MGFRKLGTPVKPLYRFYFLVGLLFKAEHQEKGLQGTLGEFCGAERPGTHSDFCSVTLVAAVLLKDAVQDSRGEADPWPACRVEKNSVVAHLNGGTSLRNAAS